MLRIRLTRTGKKKQPNYRIVVAEHTAPIQGKFIDIIGHYNPFTKKIVIDKEKTMDWMNKGAKPSNTIAKLLKKEGMEHKSIVIKIYKTKSKAELEKEKIEKEAEKAKEQAEKEAAKVEFEKKVEEEKAEAAAEKAEAETQEQSAEENKAENTESKEPEKAENSDAGAAKE